MPTIPTGKMELELRRLYVRWLSHLGDETNMDKAVDRFEKQSIDLIEKMGGRTAMLGALADFPAPKRLDLSPHIGTIYSDMKQAAIQAGIQAGLNASDVARAMFRNGMDKSYHRLNRLARTETVSAYWKNAWDSIEDLPELVMVWGAESGPRTCQWCLERDGMVMESSQLRDHPNGRCTPIPTLRGLVEYKGSVRADGTIYQDPTWTKRRKPAASVAEGPGKLDPATMEADPRVIKTMKDMDDFAKGMPAPSQLTKGAAKAVDDYAKGTAYASNAHLRGQKTYRGRPIDARTKAYTRKFTKEMDQMMDASLVPEDVRVVRALGADSFGGLDKLKELVGQVYTDKGYMSTSLAEKVSSSIYNVKDAVEMQITVPKGTRALYMAGESYLRSERELLLDRSTKLAIKSVTQDPKTRKWKVIASVIPGPR